MVIKMKKLLALFMSIILTLGVFNIPEYTNTVYAEGNSVSTDAQNALQDIIASHTIMALVYLAEEYPLRAEVSYDSETLVTVPSGQQVQIQGVIKDSTGVVWEYVSLYYKEVQYYGYIPRAYLACSDELFLEWEATYNVKDSTSSSYTTRSTTATTTYADVEQFPASYKEALNALKKAHPNWTFVKMNVGLDWNTVVAAELEGSRNLIPVSYAEDMKNGLYSTSWAYASQKAVEYYLDPRNSLTENYIFQYELLTYNATYHTEAAVQSFLNNTFMSGIIPNLSLTYATTFWAIGKELQVSPFHLACRVYQEQGAGTSDLISGTYAGADGIYKGYYNYFNVSAAGSTTQAIVESGLKKAKEENWYNGYYSILGGAKVISQNYILKGQDTIYLQKFDVDSSYNGLYWHQYMQNICAPFSEGQNIRKSYVNANSLNNTFVFKIPVYNNMPNEGISYNIALTPPTGYTDATIYLDGVGYVAKINNGIYSVDAVDGTVKTATMYQYNASGVPIGMYVWSLSHNGYKYVATQIPELENLISYHGLSVRITDKSGIRCKMGISTTLRSQLIAGSASGYTLVEYGTLVMNSANIAQYPLIKGGTKTLSGMSYGKNSSGVLEDKIFETVSDRYRFTSVLIDLPVAQYKTDFAFRGYIVLSKEGKEVVFYGPIVKRSIYTLAGQVLNAGQYTKDSAADVFLRKLLSDADGLNS